MVGNCAGIRLLAPIRLLIFPAAIATLLAHSLGRVILHPIYREL
jgi:hypothetical protein